MVEDISVQAFPNAQSGAYGLSRLDGEEGGSSSSRTMFNGFTVPALMTLALLAVSCRDQSSAPASSAKRADPQTFEVKGVVKEFKPDGRVIIKHEEITNYMDAMTMPFRVKETNQLAGVKAGDEIRFRLLVTEDESWIDRIARTGRSTPVAPPPSTATATNTPDFRLSDIPNFTLTNEFAQPVRLREFQGRAVALTFFFTRCPIPEYCPRLTKNFQGAIQKLKAAPNGPTNFHFLSISFDPIDTPILLRSYGKQYGYDSNHWSFVTGRTEETHELARGFGVPITPDGASFNHGFRTAIFDATGRLQAIWPVGGDMTDTIVSEITKAALATGR